MPGNVADSRLQQRGGPVVACHWQRQAMGRNVEVWTSKAGGMAVLRAELPRKVELVMTNANDCFRDVPFGNGETGTETVSVSGRLIEKRDADFVVRFHHGGKRYAVRSDAIVSVRESDRTVSEPRITLGLAWNGVSIELPPFCGDLDEVLEKIGWRIHTEVKEPGFVQVAIKLIVKETPLAFLLRLEDDRDVWVPKVTVKDVAKLKEGEADLTLMIASKMAEEKQMQELNHG